MSDRVMFGALDFVIRLPKWVQTIFGAALGFAIGEGAWAGRVWGILAMAALGGLLLVAIRIGEAAIEEAERS